MPGDGGWGHGQNVSSFAILRFQLVGRLRSCWFLMGGSVFGKGEALTTGAGDCTPITDGCLVLQPGLWRHLWHFIPTHQYFHPSLPGGWTGGGGISGDQERILSRHPKEMGLGLRPHLVLSRRLTSCTICPFLWKQRDPCLGCKRPRGIPLVLPFLLTHRGPEVSATTCCPLGPAQLPATPSSRTFQGSAAYRQGKSGYLAKGKERRCHQTVQAAPTALVPGAQERCGLVG